MSAHRMSAHRRSRSKMSATTEMDTSFRNPDGEAPESRPSSQRVTVNLSGLTVLALSLVTGITGDTKTDVINKSLQFYADIKKIIDKGGAVYIREPGETEVERVKIF